MRGYADHTVVANTPELHAALVAAIDAFEPRNVVETGTHKGTGTTQAILDALGRNCVDSFVTIESKAAFAQEARERLAIKGVRVYTGLSVSRKQAKMAISDPWILDPPAGVAVDHEFAIDYFYEIGFYHCGYTPDGDPWVPCPEVGNDAILAKLIPIERPLICLDSCGATGWVEFNEVCRLQPAPFLLFLDDVNHVKHWRSRLAIEADPVHWKIHALNFSAGWMIAERLPT